MSLAELSIKWRITVNERMNQSELCAVTESRLHLRSALALGVVFNQSA